MGSGLGQFWSMLGVPAQVVVLVLVLMSVISVGVVIERGLGLWAARRDSERFVPLAQAAFRSGLLGETLPLAERCTFSPEAELVRRSGPELATPPAAEWEANRRLLLARWGIDRQLSSLDLSLRRGLPIVGTVAATAPFIGLFGTVLGIIRAFDSLGRAGMGLVGVSRGIAEALVTTALGLFVAIPATWAHNFFTNRISGVVRGARRFSGTFLEAIAATGGPSTRRLLAREAEEPSPAAQFSSTTIRSDINVTPLVDVVLVLLIIFMVVTPAPEVALDLGISRTVTEEPGGKAPKKDQVLLRVTSANRLYVNDQEIPAEELGKALQSRFKGKVAEPLFFEAEPGVDYEEIVRILDSCSASGVKNIAIVSRKPRTP